VGYEANASASPLPWVAERPPPQEKFLCSLNSKPVVKDKVAKRPQMRRSAFNGGNLRFTQRNWLLGAFNAERITRLDGEPRRVGFNQVHWIPLIRGGIRDFQNDATSQTKGMCFANVYKVNDGYPPVFRNTFLLDSPTTRSGQAGRFNNKFSCFNEYGGVSLPLGGFRGDLRGLIGLYGRIVSVTGEFKGVNKDAHTDNAQKELPPSQFNQLKGGNRHRFLGLKIGFFTLLGGLAVGAASWFGGPLAFDGRGWQRLWGVGILGAGALGCFAIWGWGLFGSPFALFDRRQLFFGLLLGG